MRGDATTGIVRTGARLAPLLLSSAVLAWPAAGNAKAEGELAISVREPEGFAALTESQSVLLDVYFAGQRIGEARVDMAKGLVTFADPAAVVDLIPGLKEPGKVMAILSAGNLPANAHLVCARGSDRSTCGRLEPADVGIIVDRDNFRLDLFVNPELLAVAGTGEATYLPAPPDGASLVSTLGAIVSGTIGEGRPLYDLSNRLLLSRGQSRLIAELGYSGEVGFRSEEVVLQVDRPERRLLAGAFWAPGTELVGRQKLLGVGIESQIDTRLDKEEIRGTPLVVFLSQRSRVDVVRDGRILSSGLYEAGNQRIDTAALPEGAYEVVLRITGSDGDAREETRFFSKSRKIPSIGRQDFFAFAGLRIDDPFSLEPGGDLFAQAGWARRLGEQFAVDATLTYLEDEVALQAGGTFITPWAIVHGGLLGTSSGTHGGLIQVASGGFSRLHFNADLRRLELRGGSDLFPSLAFDLAHLGQAPGAALSGDTFGYWQAGATVSYSIANLQLFGSAFYRKDDDQAATYGIGPSVRWELLQRSSLRLAVDGNAAVTERGTTGYVGVSLSLVGRSSNVSARGGTRLSNIAGEPEGFAGSLAGAWRTQAFDSELSLGAGYEREPDRDNFNLSSRLRGDAVSVAGDLLHSEQDGRSLTQYSAGAETVLGFGPKALVLEGRTSSDSMVVARVVGARDGDRFEVLVDDAAAGVISGAETLSLPLPSYRAYDVRLRPLGGELVAYDGSTRRIGLYPGNVQVLEWDVKPIRIIIGRLLFADGTPIAGASLRTAAGLAETDAAGNFQIEATDDAHLEVALANGARHQVSLPMKEAEAEWAVIGDLRCCSAPRGDALAAAGLGN